MYITPPTLRLPPRTNSEKLFFFLRLSPASTRELSIPSVEGILLERTNLNSACVCAGLRALWQALRGQVSLMRKKKQKSWQGTARPRFRKPSFQKWSLSARPRRGQTEGWLHPQRRRAPLPRGRRDTRSRTRWTAPRSSGSEAKSCRRSSQHQGRLAPRPAGSQARIQCLLRSQGRAAVSAVGYEAGMPIEASSFRTEGCSSTPVQPRPGARNSQYQTANTQSIANDPDLRPRVLRDAVTERRRTWRPFEASRSASPRGWLLVPPAPGPLCSCASCSQVHCHPSVLVVAAPLAALADAQDARP